MLIKLLKVVKKNPARINFFHKDNLSDIYLINCFNMQIYRMCLREWQQKIHLRVIIKLL